MSTEMLNTPQPTNPASEQQPAGVSQPKHAAMAGTNIFRVVSAEFVKMFSLRSTRWLIGIAVAAMVGFAFIGALSLQLLRDTADLVQTSGNVSVAADPEMQAILSGQGVHASIAGSGYQITLVLLGAVAVLAITAEFSSGAIRSTLLATPKRGQLFLAKTIVVTVVTTVVMLLGLLISHYAIWPQMADFQIAEHFFTAEQWWPHLVIILFTLSCTLLGLGLGFLVRSTAGAIVSLLIIVMILPIVWMFFPGELMADIGGYLPVNLAGTAIAPIQAEDFPSREAAIGLFFAWSLVGLAAGGARFLKSDVK